MTQLSRSIRLFWFALSVCITLPLITGAQVQRKEEEPLLSEYRGVKLGWLADDVHKKLGDPANKSDEQDYYVFAEKEMIQILYDKATKKVVTISVDFMTGANGVLTPQQVFGADIETKSDGSKYRMVRYPKAGIWLSYNRTGGDSPMVTVTLQKMGP